MEKINIAELLKDCPKGMELDCILFSAKVIYKGLSKRIPTHPIVVQTEHGFEFELTQYGQIHNIVGSNCVIFPKGKTSWEGFHRPFKDGDIIACDTEKGAQLFIFKENIYNYDYVQCYMMLDCGGEIGFEIGDYYVERFATEEEKAKLLQAIKDNGYRWNTKTKTLEKLVEPQFNVGDWIIRNNKYTGIPVKVIEFNGYYSCELNGEVVNIPRNDVHNNFHLWTIDDAKDGDVLFHSDSASNGIFIFKEIVQRGTSQKVICYCDYDSEDGFCLGENHTCCWADSKILHPATKEQCTLLLQKIREAGYIWDSEKKALEKIFPYNIGTKVWVKSDKEHKYLHTIVGISRNSFGNLEYEIKEEKTGIVVHYPKELLIPITKEPKFKVGDIIQDKDGYKVKITEVNIEDECYGYESMIVKGIGGIAFKEQDDWKLVPNKFDINSLIPFESKVLVRYTKNSKWCGSFFSFIDRDIHSHCYKFVTTANKSYPMMIPYKGNEYLLGKVEDCKDFYKIWE